MHKSIVVATTALVASFLALGVLYANSAHSQSASVAATYVPIGVSEVASRAISAAWVLDTANKKVYVCSATGGTNVPPKNLGCTPTDLPK